MRYTVCTGVFRACPASIPFPSHSKIASTINCQATTKLDTHQPRKHAQAHPLTHTTITRKMDRSDSAPSCSVSGGGNARGNRSREADDSDAIIHGDVQVQTQTQQQQAQEHNIFGGTTRCYTLLSIALSYSNLNMVMMFMLMLHFMQYAMRPPCGC